MASRSPFRPRIGIVGGRGQMGRWLQSFWVERGCEVLISDRDTAISSEDLVRGSDIAFVAVPLRATPEVIRTLAGVVGLESGLVSIASLMAPSVRQLEAVRGEALCAHPVFGPTVRSCAGLPMMMAPVRGTRWHAWLVQEFTDAGLIVRQTNAYDHDASMAVVQASLHSMYVALCRAMSAAGLPPTAALEWASPTMQLQLGLAARILGQDPELYADLVVGNDLAPARLDALASELRYLAECARDGNRKAFSDAFLDARGSFGDRLDQLARRAESALERAD
jgi:prephenate dehydrogenase